MSTTPAKKPAPFKGVSMITTPARALVREPMNLLGTRFIGITGITDPVHVQTCRRKFMSYVEDKPALADVSIMFGFLTSLQVFTNDGHGGRRYLNSHGISDACSPDDPRVHNIVHLCANSSQDLARSLTLIRNSCGDKVHGVQLNIPFLKATDLRRAVGAAYHGALSDGPKHTPIFLSLEPKALTHFDWDADALAEYVGTFIYGEGGRIDPCIDRVIIDPSEGKGTPMDPEKVLPILKALHREFPGLPLICSGGLSGKTVTATLDDIIDEIPHISTDAEGGLRTEDRFDQDKANGYILATLRLFEDIKIEKVCILSANSSQ